MVPRCGLEHRLKLASKSVPVPWVVDWLREILQETMVASLKYRDVLQICQD